MTEIKKCPDDRCDHGADYWSVVQFCGQDQLWRDPATARVVMAFEDLICYCECVLGKKYCYSPNCVSNMVNVMNQCTILQLTYKEFVSLSGGDPDPCDCPCPYRECNYCDEPDIQEYVKEACELDNWWPGYPIVMSAGGGQFCTCLCPDDTAAAMTAKTSDKTEKKLAEFQPGDRVMTAGADLNWSVSTVAHVARSEQFTPIPAVGLTVRGRAITLAGDQMILAADGRLAPAIGLARDDRLRMADGSVSPVDTVEKHPVYAAPLAFLGLDTSPPDASLAGRLLDINGFLVAEYATQLFYTLDMLDPVLVADPANR